MSLPLNTPQTEADFYACQTRLQTEARLALAQAKDLARLHMEMERQKRHVSPITEMLRTTLLKVMYLVGSTLYCKLISRLDGSLFQSYSTRIVFKLRSQVSSGR